MTNHSEARSLPEFHSWAEDQLTRAAGVQPWRADPYQPVSWLEMLHFSATKFVWIGRALREIRADATIGAIAIPHEEPIFNLAAAVDEATISKAARLIEEVVEPDLRELGLNISAATAADMLSYLKKPKMVGRNYQWLIEQANMLETLLRRELIERDFFYISPERSKYFPRKKEPHVFGEEVATAFPSANFDINEAAMCMGLSRSTAAVMHLMRALEPAMRAMTIAASLELKRDNWSDAILAIEKQLTPTGVPNKDMREFLSAAAVQFRFLKDAWRNHAMHARLKYTEEESDMIFQSVKGFMGQLAKRLKE